MASRLFVIANPTHLINVKRYIETHKDHKNYVILTITYFKGYETFVRKVKEEGSISLLKTFFIDQEKSGLQLYLDILKKMVTTEAMTLGKKGFKEVLFTNYNSWLQNYLVWQSNADKKILISDGTAIFDIVDYRKRDKHIPFKGNRIFTEKVLRLKPIENLHFYSQVQLEPAEGDSLEVFKFEVSSTSLIDHKKIYFVGSPLVELSFISAELNLHYLKSLRRMFGDHTVTYFAHRRESWENLKRYDFFDEIIRDELPFEERLQMEKQLPGMVISYLSSVLINLPEAYPNIGFYYIPLEVEDIQESSFLNKYLHLKENFEKIRSKNFQNLNLSI